MIRLLLVDDWELVCQGLKATLNLESDLEVIGVANNGQTAIQQVEAFSCNTNHELNKLIFLAAILILKKRGRIFASKKKKEELVSVV